MASIDEDKQQEGSAKDVTTTTKQYDSSSAVNSDIDASNADMYSLKLESNENKHDEELIVSMQHKQESSLLFQGSFSLSELKSKELNFAHCQSIKQAKLVIENAFNKTEKDLTFAIRFANDNNNHNGNNEPGSDKIGNSNVMLIEIKHNLKYFDCVYKLKLTQITPSDIYVLKQLISEMKQELSQKNSQIEILTKKLTEKVKIGVWTSDATNSSKYKQWTKEELITCNNVYQLNDDKSSIKFLESGIYRIYGNIRTAPGSKCAVFTNDKQVLYAWKNSVDKNFYPDWSFGFVKEIKENDMLSLYCSLPYDSNGHTHTRLNIEKVA